MNGSDGSNEWMSVAMDKNAKSMLRRLSTEARKSAGRLLTAGELAEAIKINRPRFASVLINAGVLFKH